MALLVKQDTRRDLRETTWHEEDRRMGSRRVEGVGYMGLLLRTLAWMDAPTGKSGEQGPRTGVEDADEHPVDKKPCLSAVQQLIIQQAKGQVAATRGD
jgi:hypothetical protein